MRLPAAAAKNREKLHFLHNYLFIILAKTFYCWPDLGYRRGRPVAQTAAAFFLGI
jgi:hypothetical protein